MLNYSKTGNSTKTLVFIHGFCENNTCFDKQVLFFSKEYTCIEIDLPGFGKSVLNTEASIDDMAMGLKIVLDHEKINHCFLFGHSMGGYVTLAFAEKFPEYVLGFGLIHSTTIPDSDERKEKRKQVISFIEQQGKETYIQNFIPTLFHSNARKVDVAFAISQGLDSSDAGIINALKAMMNRPDRTHVLINSKVPVFFVIGKNDSIIPETDLFELSSLPNSSHICYLKNSAHMGMLEEPEALNQSLQQFLNIANIPN